LVIFICLLHFFSLILSLIVVFFFSFSDLFLFKFYPLPFHTFLFSVIFSQALGENSDGFLHLGVLAKFVFPTFRVVLFFATHPSFLTFTHAFD